jgi:hypothetical protein
VVVLAAPAWARKPGDPIKPGYNAYSHQQDIQLGQVEANQVKVRYPEVQDEFLRDYIKRIGERLANTPEALASQFPFQFTLLNVPLVNAFALPGGPMFVFTGLIKSTENEAQLAGVMAHEMSHVILRHGTHEASKAKAANWTARLSAAIAAGVLGNSPALGELANMGVGLGRNSIILHFSREAESEADLLGTHLMAEAGYDPIEMARFFQKLGAADNAGLEFFSDHPNPDNRERAIDEEIGGLPPRTYGYESGEFQRAKADVNALPPGGRGTLAGTSNLPPQLRPSGTLQQAHAKTFGVSYPANWTAYNSSSASRLVVAPTGGASQLANGTINLGIGVALGYFQPDSSQMTLGTATLNLVTHLHEQDPSLQLTSAQQRSARIDGSDGLISVLVAKSPTLGLETNLLVTVARPQGLFYALSIAPQRQFPQLQSAFEQILRSIHFEQ